LLQLCPARRIDIASITPGSVSGDNARPAFGLRASVDHGGKWRE